MEIGFVGLGRMGGAMVARLQAHGHRVVAWDPDPGARERTAATGATVAADLAGVAAALSAPRAIWVMVPAGEATETTCNALGTLLAAGDSVVDGGNSYFRDTVRRAQALAARGITLIDCGTSGGIWGASEGYCLMIGGDQQAVARLDPIWTALAPSGGYRYMGPSGSGHFVKMVHNGIEYGLLEAYGEGFELLQGGPYQLDLGAIADLWLHGSVVRSWLLELLSGVYRDNPGLEGIADWVADSGEGRWTVAEAIQADIPTPVLTLALLARLRSRQSSSYSAKVIAALRKAFGGHPVRPAGPADPS